MRSVDLVVTSFSNSKVKEVVKLRDRRQRDKSDLFLIEGYRELLRAADGDRDVERLFICPELFLGENEEDLIDRFSGQLIECSKEVFEKISYRDRPDGLLAIAKQQHLTLQDLESRLSEVPLLLVAEAIEKPGNLGTILRSADAAGADGVILCDRCTDLHNPNVVRASTATLFTVPVVECSMDQVLLWLKEKGIQLVAATPAASVEYTKSAMGGPIAIAVGTEQLGLSDRMMQSANIQVSIPMYGEADSLNVATATTLLLYEARRQR